MILAKMPIEAVLLIAGIAGLVVVIIAASVIRDRRRRQAISKLLSSHGFTLRSRPDREAQRREFEPFGDVSHLRHGAKGVRWSAAGTLDGVDIRIIEHSYVVSTGKTSHAVVNVCVAAVGRAGTGGGAWPLLRLGVEGWFHRIGEKVGLKPDIRVESEEFNRRWRVRCDDEGFALAVLSPSVQAAMMTCDAKDWWSIGGSRGVLCHGRTGTVNAPALGAMLHRLREVARALEPEVRSGLGLTMS